MGVGPASHVDHSSNRTATMTMRTATLALLGTFFAAALHGQAPEEPDILWSYDTGG